MTRMTLFAAAVALGLVGCGPGTRPDPVPVKGQVTLADGRPVKDVMMTLQPMDKGHMASLKVGADGTFSGDLIPGKYAFFFVAQQGKSKVEQQRLDAAFRAIPEKYRDSNKDHTVKVDAGTVEIKLN